tara:strand:+ start:2175 stop:2453 length:279 start_codon:yes stop_codon:yes gene_type:complete
MGQYDDRVERQRLLLEAEEWSKGIKALQIHNTTSMWYETDLSRMTDFDNGHVTDTSYNSGLIERTQKGKLIRTFGNALKGDALIDHYVRSNA